jgi:hypothetical protein
MLLFNFDKLIKRNQLLDMAIANIYIWWFIAGWSSLVARRAHNPKVTGSNPVPATNILKGLPLVGFFC